MTIDSIYLLLSKHVPELLHPDLQWHDGPLSRRLHLGLNGRFLPCVYLSRPIFGNWRRLFLWILLPVMTMLTMLRILNEKR